MLPAGPHFVKNAAATATRPVRARRMRLAALFVLAAHALLLGLLWDRQPPPVQRPAMVQVSVLAPATAAAQKRSGHPQAALETPAMQRTAPPSAAKQSARPIQPADHAASQPAATQSRPPAPALAAQPPQLTAPAASAANAANIVQPPGQAAAGTDKPAPAQTLNAAAGRIEPPDSTAGYLDNPAPPYPPVSRRLGEQGLVLLRVWVEADGRPGKVELKRSSGHERLDRAAMQVVQRWSFAPGKRGGWPEAMWAEVPLQFVLE